MDIANALSHFPRMNLLDSYITLHDFPRPTVDVGGLAIAGKRNDALALAFGGNKVCKLRRLLRRRAGQGGGHCADH